MATWFQCLWLKFRPLFIFDLPTQSEVTKGTDPHSCTDPPGALRGPLRGASGEPTDPNRKQWARRAHCLLALGFCEAQLKAPRSGPRRAPGGSVQRLRICKTTLDNSTVSTVCFERSGLVHRIMGIFFVAPKLAQLISPVPFISALQCSHATPASAAEQVSTVR